MKSLIEKELPSSSELYTGGDESLIESGVSVYDTYGVSGLFGAEMEAIILETCIYVVGVNIPLTRSLFELKQVIYCCDALIAHTKFEGRTPMLRGDNDFFSQHKIHRKWILTAIENGNYSDDIVLSDSELDELRTPVEFDDYIDTDFSVYEFTKALEEDEYLIRMGFRNKGDSEKQNLLDLREDLYENITSNMDNQEIEEFFELHKYDKTYIFNYDTI